MHNENNLKLFQKGLRAQQEGNFLEAETCYHRVLKEDVWHPDANHNLGVLRLKTGQVEEALTHFNLAASVKPDVEQYWVSLILTVLVTKNTMRALEHLKSAEANKVSSEKISSLRQKIKETQQIAALEPIISIYNAGEYQEAYTQILKLGKVLEYSDEYYRVKGACESSLEMGRSAIESLSKALRLNPNSIGANKSLGKLYYKLGQYEDAIMGLQKAFDLGDRTVAMLGDLALCLSGLGRDKEATDFFKRALNTEPNSVVLNNNYGMHLHKTGNLESAAKVLKVAAGVDQANLQAVLNLGNVRYSQGDFAGALHCYARVLQEVPDKKTANYNFAITLREVEFRSGSKDLHEIIRNVITRGHFVRPKEVAPAILTLLRTEPEITTLLQNEKQIGNIDEINQALAVLENNPLLLLLISNCPIADLDFERLFRKLREAILVNISQLYPQPKLYKVLKSIALHCFINEYVYETTPQEEQLTQKLVIRIEESLDRKSTPSSLELLCLASYRPIHKLRNIERFPWIGDLSDCWHILVDEPIEELQIISEILSVGDTKNETSLKVQAQYQLNPYPRWRKLGLNINKKTVWQFCEENRLNIPNEIAEKIKNPLILVAGCGTGQHPIETASTFLNSNVEAIDLSAESLSFALRSTRKLGYENVINYTKADILEVGKLGHKFDIIESVGVLHHMADPVLGWENLVSVLKPGGIMKIGLYSKLARLHINEIRKEIVRDGIEFSESSLKSYREMIIYSKKPHHRALLSSHDFYSTSSLRDLIFHEQEHQFTLQQISDCLAHLKLKFCGFDNKLITQKFERNFPNPANFYNLKKWEEFENSHPSIFSNMYQFWCMKLD